MPAIERRLLSGWPFWLLLVLILAGGLALRARFLDASFGEGFRAVNGGWYFGQFEKQYQEHGITGTKGAMVLQSWPGTTERMVYDLNHPPTAALLFHCGVVLAGGELTARNLRLVPFLLATLGLLTLALLAFTTLGRAGGLATTLIAATSPMWAFHGVQCAAQSGLLFGGSLLALLTHRYLEGRGRLVPLVITFFLLCLLDWPYFFMSAGVWMMALLHPARRTRWKPLLWLLPVGMVAFLLFCLHAAWVLGGVEALLTYLKATAQTAGTATFTSAQWFSAQWGYLTEGYTLPLVIASVPLLLLATLRTSPAGRAAWLFVIAGALDVVIFRKHAFDHPFWTMGLAGGLYLVIGDALARALGGRVRLAGLGLALLTLTIAALGTRTTLRLQNEERNERTVELGREINGLTRSSDILLTSEPWRHEMFTIEARTFPWIRDRATMDRVLADYQAVGCQERIVLLFREAEVATNPELAAMATFAEQLSAVRRDAGTFRLYYWDPPR